LTTVLKQIVQSASGEDLERYVRFLETDTMGRISYVQFLEQFTKQVNKNHNPFRTLVNRLAYFIKHNNVSVAELLKRIGSSDSGVNGIKVARFADFLKQKVDKKADQDGLAKLSIMIDVDKDGIVCETDISTCIKNLQNNAFWRKNPSGPVS
jgi:Ca2+-binding EF-hand superfamily protein